VLGKQELDRQIEKMLENDRAKGQAKKDTKKNADF
jgi:hypothetical protein